MNIKRVIVSVLAVIFTVSTFSFASLAEAKVKVKGYTKKSTGTYVKPHYRSDKDSRKSNNWSSKGNYNPYTGKKGYKKW